jgi:hypothetical protein
MQSRWFTPQTAQEALVSLREPAEAIARAWRRLESSRPRPVRPDTPVDPGYFALSATLRAAIERIARTGARLRDGRSGTLEFPARRGGRPVILCWTLGDASPVEWHVLDAEVGCASPLDDGPWDPWPATPTEQP